MPASLASNFHTPPEARFSPGYLLGSQISDWSHQMGFRLSTLLRMYYSPDGVSYDRRFRACDRLTNFLDAELVDQETLKDQVRAPSARVEFLVQLVEPAAHHRHHHHHRHL